MWLYFLRTTKLSHFYEELIYVPKFSLLSKKGTKERLLTIFNLALTSNLSVLQCSISFIIRYISEKLISYKNCVELPFCFTALDWPEMTPWPAYQMSYLQAFQTSSLARIRYSYVLQYNNWKHMSYKCKCERNQAPINYSLASPPWE